MPVTVPLDQLDLTELQEMCNDRGLNSKGSKHHLINRLKAWRAVDDEVAAHGTHTVDTGNHQGESNKLKKFGLALFDILLLIIRVALWGHFALVSLGRALLFAGEYFEWSKETYDIYGNAFDFATEWLPCTILVAEPLFRITVQVLDRLSS